MHLSGMFVPVPTAFDDDGSIDANMMRELIDHYIGAGVDALFFAASCGNGPAMSVEERKQLATLALKHVAGRLPVVVHCGTADPYTSIDLARHAIAAGA